MYTSKFIPCSSALMLILTYLQSALDQTDVADTSLPVTLKEVWHWTQTDTGHVY